MQEFDFLENVYSLEKFADFIYAGRLQGFYTIVNITEENTLFKIKISVCNDDEKKLADKLSKLNYKYDVKFECSTKMIFLDIQMKNKYEDSKKIFNDIIQKTLTMLINTTYTSGSFLSGESENLILTCIGQNYMYLTNEEYHQFMQEIKSQKKIKSNTDDEENTAIGITLLYFIGFISIFSYMMLGKSEFFSICIHFITIMTSYFIYKHFAGKITKKSFLLTIIILSFILPISIIFKYAKILYDKIKISYDYKFIEILIKTPKLIFETKNTSIFFIKDLAISMIVLFISVLFLYVFFYKKDIDK